MLIVKTISDLPYVTPLQLPIKWQDDQSGQVSGAIWAYICHCADPKNDPEPTQQQLRITAEYCRYYINAPCWDSTGGFTEELAQLRRRIDEIMAAETVGLTALRRWIHDCLEIAIDPL